MVVTYIPTDYQGNKASNTKTQARMFAARPASLHSSSPPSYSASDLDHVKLAVLIESRCFISDTSNTKIVKSVLCLQKPPQRPQSSQHQGVDR